MKNYEESYLKKAAIKIRSYAKDHCEIEDFYQKLSTFDVMSLQDLSFERDREFFGSISSILTVIASIAAHPYTLNKQEEVIVRSGTTNGLTDEAFRKTMTDSQLWKRHGREMIPEEVYYYQYYDELKTYENIFIVMLIDLISSELEKCRDFYISILKAIDYGSTKLNVEMDQQEVAMQELMNTIHKVSKIKNTLFYRTVSKATNRPKTIVPTNILLRNQMYNTCYRFYKAMTTYDDEADINADLDLYFFFTIVKEMKRRGMWLRVENEENIFRAGEMEIPSELVFSNAELSIKIARLSQSNVYRMEILDNEDESSSAHILVITSDDTFSNVIEPDGSWEADSVDYISIWHLASYENGEINRSSIELMTEKEMVSKFIDSHHTVMFGSESLYSTYCPVCREQELNLINGRYVCGSCHSIYKILETKDEKHPHKIVFTNLRRK